MIYSADWIPVNADKRADRGYIRSSLSPRCDALLEATRLFIPGINTRLRWSVQRCRALSISHLAYCVSRDHRALYVINTQVTSQRQTDTKRGRTSCMTFDEFTRRPRSFRICLGQLFTKLRKFLQTQQLTKLSNLKGNFSPSSSPFRLVIWNE